MIGQEEPKTVNHHCTILSVEGVGIMIEGRSGVGKTSLAMAIMERAETGKFDAHWVCDDQALLRREADCVIGGAPDATAGLAEIHGFGIVPVPHMRECRIDLVARLVNAEDVVRMPENRQKILLGVPIAEILLPETHEAGALRILLAWLKYRQFPE